MKKLHKILLVALMITIIATVDIYSQPPPPPADHGSTTNQGPNGGAPIGGGLFILLGLGAAYGGKKIYDLRNENIDT